MFLNKNVLILARYTRNVFKNAPVVGKIYLKECQSFLSQFSLVKNFSSQTIREDNTINLENNVISNKGQEEKSNMFSDFEDITKGDKEQEHKLKVIMLETEVLRQDGKLVPPDDFMTPEIWESLLKLPSRSSRTKYLQFLYKTSKKKENRIEKKLEKRKQYEEALPNLETPKHLPIEDHALKYGLLYNNIFLRFIEPTINRFYNGRLIQATQFGQKLVIDCGYDQNMTRRENQNSAKQIMLLFSENRNNDEPFDIHYTNIDKESDLTKMLHKYIPTMYDADFPMNMHEKSYLDLFPKEKLVYLTPHCKEEMNTFDHDAIYIVGAIVDKINNEPLSMAKAKREGIAMKKFPLDRYLQWSSGSGKSLTINQCVSILLDLKDTNDWNHALRHVPKRKLMDTTSSIPNFEFTSRPRSFISQKKNTWKPNTSKNLRNNERNWDNN